VAGPLESLALPRLFILFQPVAVLARGGWLTCDISFHLLAILSGCLPITSIFVVVRLPVLFGFDSAGMAECHMSCGAICTL
jgi:hypothetical protein